MRYEVLTSSFTGRVFLFSACTLPVLTTLQILIFMLVGAIVIDYLTGWFASTQEVRRGEKPMPKSGYTLESSKARDTIPKVISYILLILGSAAIEYVFLDRKFTISTVTTKSFGITELVVGFCFGIEMYSAVIENMKRAGFDFIGKAGKVVDSFWSFKKKLTNG